MQNQTMGIAGAIILAGLIIAGAVIYVNKDAGPQVAGPEVEKTTEEPQAPSEIPGVKSDDHVLGNPDATLTLIEYSDIECPYCKNFHQTIKQVMDAYGKDGKIKWVYRHFPLEMLHPNAPLEAEATECAAELGGNEKFWEFLNMTIEKTPFTGSATDGLVNIATDIGLDKNAFKVCLESGKYSDKIEAGINEAISAGIGGTPFSIIRAKDGTETVIPGALPYADVSEAIESLLNG